MLEFLCFIIINRTKCIFRFGRKNSLIFSIIPMLISWLLILVSRSVLLLYLARFLGGITDGISCVIVPMYLGEISSDKYRGALLIMFIIMNKAGYVYSFALAPYLSYTAMAWVSMVPPIIFLLVSFWLPESPYYLIGKNRHSDAEKSLIKIKSHQNVENDLRIIYEAVEKSNKNQGTLKEIMTKGNRKSLILIIIFAILQPLSGSTTILIYSPMIFKKIGFSIGASESSIMLSVIQLISAVIASLCIDRIGRRPLLLWSVCGLAIFNICVTVFFYLERKDINTDNLSWLPFVSLMAIMFFYIIGIGSVTYALLGEIFPKHLKALAGGVFFLFFPATLLIVQKLFQIVIDNWGNDVAFMIFAIVNCLSIPYVWFCVPETKGKSLADILTQLNSS